MKTILSRKGFAAENGGYPSPIMPDGRLVSLPIPNDWDAVRYSELLLDGRKSYFDLMQQLKSHIRIHNKWIDLNSETRCHVDPDIVERALLRKTG
jgi:hypothetical protein